MHKDCENILYGYEKNTLVYIVCVIFLLVWIDAGVGGAVSILVVGTIGEEERQPRGQLRMEQCLTSLKYWPFLYTIWADPN